MPEPLRIGMLVDRFPELSETFIAAEAQELMRLGHAVRVESRDRAAHPDPAAAAGIAIAFRCDDGRARRLRDLAWLVSRHPLRCVRDLVERRRWRREEPVPPLRRLAPPARRLHGFRAVHLHAHFAAGAALDALRIGALLDLPYSVMTHGYDIFSERRNLREKHERAAVALSPCDYSVRHLRHILGPAPRIERLVTGVDGDRFARRRPYPAGNTLIAVGRLVEKKGFEVLLDAVAGLPEVERLTIVGDGPLRARLTQQIAALGIEGRVELAGAQVPARVRERLENAALLVAPCVVARDGDRDTMPVVVKEALAMELPVVASNEVGLPELVRPEWGRLVEPGNADALAGAIAELLELPLERRREMGRAGREFVLRECSLRGETQRLATLIAASGH